MAISDYLKDVVSELKRRRKESKVYSSFQLHGLELAEILHDEKHKALYIKLAKNYDVHKLRRLAKSIAEKKDVANAGAYFMAVFTKDKTLYERKHLPKRTS